MKKILLVLFCAYLLLSCQTKDNSIKLPESIEKVSIIELNGWPLYYEIENDSLVLDADYDDVMGLVEIDKNFRLNIVKKWGTENKYKSGETYAADWMRNAIIKTIDSFSSDSIDTEEKIRIYDGHYCFLLIEKNNGQKIFLGGSPDAVSPDLKELSYFLEDSVEAYIHKEIENQDSIKIYMKKLGKYRPEHLALPPLPPLPVKGKRSF